jgi:hypothetical protein
MLKVIREFLGNVAQQMGLYKQCRFGSIVELSPCSKIVAVDPLHLPLSLVENTVESLTWEMQDF